MLKRRDEQPKTGKSVGAVGRHGLCDEAGQVANIATSQQPENLCTTAVGGSGHVGILSGLSYRDLEEWQLASEAIWAALELKQVPDHASLCRAYGALSEGQQRSLNAWLLKQQGVQTSAVAMDATGFSPTHASQHDLSRCGRKLTHYHKGFCVIDLEHCYILGRAARMLPISRGCALKPCPMPAAMDDTTIWLS